MFPQQHYALSSFLLENSIFYYNSFDFHYSHSLQNVCAFAPFPRRRIFASISLPSRVCLWSTESTRRQTLPRPPHILGGCSGKGAPHALSAMAATLLGTVPASLACRNTASACSALLGSREVSASRLPHIGHGNWHSGLCPWTPAR